MSRTPYYHRNDGLDDLLSYDIKPGDKPTTLECRHCEAPLVLRAGALFCLRCNLRRLPKKGGNGNA
jgi:uncharacterized Zn finger protein (UPF0148 family)